MTPTETQTEDDPEESWEDVDAEEWRDDLREQYAFYVLNPEWSEGVNYSLYHYDGETEMGILSSNTGGFHSWSSRDDAVGDGLDPTDEFLNTVAWATHEALCFIPNVYWRDDHFKRTVDAIYDRKPREYEVWAAECVARALSFGSPPIPELVPLAEWADAHTEIGTVPLLMNQGPARLWNLSERLGQQCADCGRKAPVYGPINFDGERYESGDFCCRTCAIDRGVIEEADDGD